jgi:uncharacterized protein involved in exopolysaccharide biosynthesis
VSESAHRTDDRLEESDADLIAYAEVVWRRKWVFASVVTLVLIAAFVRTMYFKPEMYGSAVTILPLKQAEGGALGMLRQMGGAAGALAGLGLGGAGGDAERLVSILRTRGLAETVMRRHGLLERIGRRDLSKRRRDDGASFGATEVDRIVLELLAAYPSGIESELTDSPGLAVLALEDASIRDAVGALSGWTGSTADLDVAGTRDAWYAVTQARLRMFRTGVRVEWDRKQSVIKVVVMFERDPVLAAALANTYVAELRNHLSENTSTEARRNLVFIESRFRKVEDDLEAAEGALERFEQEHELVSLTEQTAYAVSRLGTLEAALAAKEIMRDVLDRARVAPGSAAVSAVEAEIRGLDSRLSQAKLGQGSAVGTMALSDLPSLKRDLAELMRAKVVQETLFTLLAQQFELAKIDEAREEVAFETLDVAVPPTERSSPKRKMDMIIGLGAGGVLALLCVAFLEMLASRRLRATDPETAIG